MPHSSPAPTTDDTPAKATVDTSADGDQQAAGEAKSEVDSSPSAVASPAASPVEPDPGPASVEPAAEAVPPAADTPAGGTVTPPELPDPEHLVGDRPCPICDGAGRIPFSIRQLPGFRRCEDCGGVGQGLTGSLVGDASVFDCPSCEGHGYTTTGPAPAGVGAGATLPAAAAPTAADAPPWPGATWDVSTARWV